MINRFCHKLYDLRLHAENAFSHFSSFPRFVRYRRKWKSIFPRTMKKKNVASRRSCAKLHSIAKVSKRVETTIHVIYRPCAQQTSFWKRTKTKHKAVLTTLKVKVAPGTMIVIIKFNFHLMLRLGGILCIPLRHELVRAERFYLHKSNLPEIQ